MQPQQSHWKSLKKKVFWCKEFIKKKEMTLCCSFSKQIITACHADKGCHGKQFAER